MGKYFSDAVEEALTYIYYDIRVGKGAKGFELLQKASEEGDGDASCILARCYGGGSYVWSGHNFPEDDDLVAKYIHKSVEQGSALGVLVAMRCGEFSPEMKRQMPFANLEEVFQIVLQKAEAGEPFCQYAIGNAYFWLDFIDIQGKTPESFGSREAFAAYLRENMLKCEEWFQRALQGGMHKAANNLRSLYVEGNDGFVQPRPELVKDLYKMGAERGYPDHQWSYANQLDNSGKSMEALYWYEQAAKGGQFECWRIVGDEYMDGKLVPRNVNYAVECYEKALKQTANTRFKLASASQLGWIYCEGKGMPRDGEKAFPLLKLAVDNGETRRVASLGKCYFHGWGTPKDYGKARECFEKATACDEESNYMLGVIYAQGLGVAEDIGKGVKFLKMAGNFPEAKAELAKYKKPLFGKWVRV